MLDEVCLKQHAIQVEDDGWSFGHRLSGLTSEIRRRAAAGRAQGPMARGPSALD